MGKFKKIINEFRKETKRKITYTRVNGGNLNYLKNQLEFNRLLTLD